jgi:hypothetical protein
MTSRNATSTSNYQIPLQQLQAELQQEVDSGTINLSDENALSSALNDINSSLQGGSSSSSGSENSSPADLKSKVDSLIANEVSSGKLTQQQATELQNLFQNAFSGGSQGAGSSGSLGTLNFTQVPLDQAAFADALNGATPITAGAVPPSATGNTGSGGGANNSNGTNDSSGTESAVQILQQFLQSLQNSTPSNATYNANGNATSINSSNPSLSSFLINYQS